MTDQAEGYWTTAEQMGYSTTRLALPGEKQCLYCANWAGLLIWDDDLGEIDVCFEHSDRSEWRPAWEYGFKSDEWTHPNDADFVQIMDSREVAELACRNHSGRRPVQRYMGGDWETVLVNETAR